MNKNTASFVALLMLGLLTSCGRPVPQNEVCLVLRTLGDRTAPVANQTVEGSATDVSNQTVENPATDVSKKLESEDVSDAHKRIRESVLTANAELVYARRAPLDTPGVILLYFELGKHAYKFSAGESFESPTNEEFVIDCVGGKVHFDFCIHMHIDRTLPDLKERLLMLTQDYQLRQYAGQRNVLGLLAKDRFQRIIREPLQDYCAPKNPIEIVRGKEEINRIALTYMNDMFGKYGIHFTMAAIASPIRLETEQQEQMNGIVTKEYQKRALDLQTGEKGLKALEQQITEVTESALTEAENVVNTANATTVQLVSDANKRRRKTMLDLIGDENYVQLEALLIMVRNLEEGKTTINLVPRESQIWIGDNKAN